MTHSDILREQRIADLQKHLREAKSSDQALIYWRLLGDEIKARSPGAVDQMERDKGLR